MPHETKHCPKCGAAFECRVGDVINCQCYGIELSGETEFMLQQQYPDACFCRNCLLQMQQRHIAFLENKGRYGQR